MTDPVPRKLRKPPRRAEPMQPDNPTRGDDAPRQTTPQRPSGDSVRNPAHDDAADLERAREQADTALDNVRNP